MWKKLKIAFVFSVLFLINNAYAQILSFTQYSTEDGLPQSSVYSIIQDHNDFLWVATEEGAARFDGSEFLTFTTSNGLPYNHVRVIFEDYAGNIWFGTNKGLGLLRNNTCKISAINDSLGFVSDFVYSIAQSKDSTVFFATGHSGLFSYSKGGFRKINVSSSYFTDSLTNVYVDKNNTLWVGTANAGLWLAENCNTGALKKFTPLKVQKIVKIYMDKKGGLWVSSNSGTFIINGNSVTKVTFLQDAIPLFFFEDVSDKMWIGTQNNGVFVYDAGEVVNFREKNGLSRNTLLCGIEDKRGDIWFGYRDGGLSRLPVEKFIIYNKASGLADNSVFGIYKDRWNRLWFGHFSEGVTLYYRNRSKILTEKDGILGGGAAAFIQLDPFNVIIAAIQGLAIYRDGAIQDTIRFFPRSSAGKVLSLLQKDKKRLIVGTSEGVDFFALDSLKKVSPPSAYDTLRQSWVQSMFHDFDNNICITTDPKGVFFFRNDSLIKNLTTNDGLLSNIVFWGLQNERGEYWFFTDLGISIYDGVKFASITEKDGLPASTCYFGIESGNFIFVGTPKGVVRINYVEYPEKGKDALKIYTKRDGFAGTEMNMFGVFKDKRENLFFGSTEGVTQLNPKEKPRKAPSATYIKNVKIISDETEIDTLPSATLELVYYLNNVTIDYRGIVFSDPDKIFYKYKLEGIDKHWTETQEHTITYRALPPGEYIFKVKCRNQDGIWGETNSSLRFIITPPFWETWWFRLLIVVALISIAYGISIYKTRQIRKRNLELARLVRERTKELQKEKDKTDELIHNILPAQAVKELKAKGYVEPRLFDEVTILFTDFKDFTSQASNLPPGELVDELNKIFLEFDNIIEKYGLEKLKTIGDAYMAAGGVPIKINDHAERVVRAALDMQNYIKSNKANFRVPWQMRAGVHTGTVVAGVVGKKKFTYDVWGDAVNIASRMESSGVPGYVNISASTYEKIKDKFVCEYRGKIDAKGKGKMDMYLVIREK